MITIHPNNHKRAIKVWLRLLGGKPNGARTLGSAINKYCAKCFEPYYDMLITYASDIAVDVPNGVKKIAIAWHQNYPWVNGLACWKKVNAIYSDYEVDYFCNEPRIIELIKEQGGNAYYLPRFIDTTTLPTPSKEKTIPTLWYGNRWAEFANEFAYYKQYAAEPLWISQGQLGLGDNKIRDISRSEALEILNQANVVWAIGVSQLEAKYLGAEVVSYRGDPHPFYTQETIVPYLEELLTNIN